MHYLWNSKTSYHRFRVHHGKRIFQMWFSNRYYSLIGNRSRQRLLSLFSDSSDKSIAVMVWNVAHCTFAVRRYFENSHSATQTKCDFRNHFNTVPRDVPDHNTILKWVTALNNTGYILSSSPVNLSVVFVHLKSF